MLKEREFCITHDGKFHADDVFSAALIKHIFGKDVEIIRCNKIPNWMRTAALVIFDTDGGKFDHHDPEKLQYRDNGIPYASFGLLWRYYAPYMFSPDIVKRFDSTFIQNLDFTDNGGHKNMISQTISAMNPVWDDDEDSFDVAFTHAVDWAYDILDTYFRTFNAEIRADKIVQRCIKATLERNENILILEKGMPFFRSVNNVEDIKFVVARSSRGNWNLRAISKFGETSEFRIPFPETWSTECLNGCSFIHAKRYLAVFDTKENALAAAKMAIEEYEEEKESDVVEYEKVG